MKTSLKAKQGELVWQARWFSGELGNVFEAADGGRLKVLNFGVWNHGFGPDFVDVVIEFEDGQVLKGSVELDWTPLDWERHGHSTNPDYEQVILHVCLLPPSADGKRERFFTRTRLNRLVRQVFLGRESAGSGKIGEIAERWEFKGGCSEICAPGRCSQRMRQMTVGEVERIVLKAAQQRFRRRCAELERVAGAHGKEEALFQSLAMGLGYKGNELPFLLLAQRLPVSFLRGQAGVNSLLFGVAGMIPHALDGMDSEAREVARRMWEQWWRIRGEEGRGEIPEGVWRVRGQRPANHPRRRLAALGEMVRDWPALNLLFGRRDWLGLSRRVGGLENSFWSWRHGFASKRTSRPVALIGAQRVRDLLLNAWLPAAGDWETWCRLSGGAFGGKIRVAAARILGEFGRYGSLLRKGVFQQGLLELERDFCGRDWSGCAKCVLPKAIGAWGLGRTCAGPR